MSFPIQFQRTNSAPNVLNKELVDVALATGTLRSGTSLTRPVITIDSVLAEDFIGLINYAYIEAFKRYYYVDDIVSFHNHLWRVSMHVDVLMSWKEQILANAGVIGRQAERWDLYLDDGTFRSDQDPYVGIRTFPNGFSTYEWVLAVAGNQNASPLSSTSSSSDTPDPGTPESFGYETGGGE